MTTEGDSVRVAVFPGSFDPITNGHLDVITRALRLFDRVVVAVLVNERKQPLFSQEERVEMLADVIGGQPRVRIATFDGLLVDFARQQGATAILRGVRAISDFEYEMQMALMNRRLAPAIDTVFLMPAEENTYVSSRLVKEVFMLGGRVSGLVPAPVERRLHGKRTMRAAGPGRIA
jgi:pantetheine-phosphate adenylyltransferase